MSELKKLKSAQFKMGAYDSDPVKVAGGVYFIVNHDGAWIWVFQRWGRRKGKGDIVSKHYTTKYGCVQGLNSHYLRGNKSHIAVVVSAERNANG